MNPEEKIKFEKLKSNITDKSSLENFMSYATNFPKEKKQFTEEAYKKNLEERKNFPEVLGSKEFVNLPDYQGQVEPNTDLLCFTFKEAYKKDKHLKRISEKMMSFLNNPRDKVLDLMDIKSPQIFNKVITERIDYSEYSDLSTFKGVISIKKYKDGLLLISEETGKKQDYLFALSFQDSMTQLDRGGQDPLVHFQRVFALNDSVYKNQGEIDWNDSIFDSDKIFNMYLVFPKIRKDLTFKFSFKNNLYLNKMFNHFRSEEKITPWPGDLKYFRQKAEAQYSLFQNWGTASNLYEDDNKTLKEHQEFYKKKMESVSNYDFLQLGYKTAIIDLADVLLRKYSHEKILKLMNEYKTKSLYEIFELGHYEKLEKEFFIEGSSDTYETIFVELIILLYHTNEGTTFCNKTPLNYENKMKLDCYYFWITISHIDLYFNILNKHNFPLKIIDGIVMNDLDMFDSRHLRYENRKAADYTKDLTNIRNFKFKNKYILDEAMNNQTGYLMPYDSIWPIKGDPFYKFAKFREQENLITILICDENERYISEVFFKKQKNFANKLVTTLLTKENEDLLQEIYTKLALTIRNFKVLVERDSTMGYRGRIKPYDGCKTDSLYDVYYFPRVKYIRNPNEEYIKKREEFFKESRNFSGSRIQHIRKLPDGSSPSKLQILLAKAANMHLPPNYTYVKPTMWGKKGMLKKEKIYRTKAIDGLFFYDQKDMDKAIMIGQLGPAGFEEYCEKLLFTQGWKTSSKKNSYDGGIDIRAFKEFKDGSIKNLFVQCKHWTKPVPPEHIRAFITACNIEKSEYEKVKMFITSNKFSPGATTLAKENQIELIDGDILLKERGFNEME